MNTSVTKKIKKVQKPGSKTTQPQLNPSKKQALTERCPLSIYKITYLNGSINILVRPNPFPIVGILTMPGEPNISDTYQYPEHQIVVSNNVQFIEQSGVKCVPLPFDLDNDMIKLMMGQLNGILMTGGIVDIDIKKPFFGQDSSVQDRNVYTEKVNFIMETAKQINDNGVHFPVIGICQGMQLMAYVASGYNKILDDFENDTNISRNMVFKNSSRMFKQVFDPMLRQYAERNAPLFQYHVLGITQEMIDKNEGFNKFYVATGWSYNSEKEKDKNSKKYVTFMEARQYPFYGIQHHPEFTQFYFGNTLKTNRESRSLLICQKIANFIGEQCRWNNQKFLDNEFQRKLYFYNQKLTMVEAHKDFGPYYIYNKSDLKIFDQLMQDKQQNNNRN